MEEEYPSDFTLPDVLPGQNVYDPTRRPSDNLTIHRMGVPLQCDTYDMLDSRNGSSVFDAPYPEVHPKLRTPEEKLYAEYIKGLKKEDISFYKEYPSSGAYPNQNNPETMESLVRSRPSVVRIKNSIISEPTGMTYKESFNGAKASKNVNAVMYAPGDLGQEELRLFAKTGRWF
jgi:hypothetical protein